MVRAILVEPANKLKICGRRIRREEASGGAPTAIPATQPPKMSERIVHCRLLKKDLPGLDRPPYRNELGQKLYAEVSKEGWERWLKDSVRYINTYRVDLASNEGQKFMLKQCAVYFGFEEGDLAQTAWVSPSGSGDAPPSGDPPPGKGGESS